MSESPSPNWLEHIAVAILSGILSGIGGAMAWFAKSNNVIHARIDGVEENTGKALERVLDRLGDHTTRIAVLETHTDNHIAQLNEIKETTRDTNQKLDSLLLAMKHGRP